MNATVRLKPGQRVAIFRDPLDCRMPEGDAYLVKRDADAESCGWYHGSPIERWYVRFPGEDTEVLRSILLHPGVRPSA